MGSLSYSVGLNLCELLGSKIAWFFWIFQIGFIWVGVQWITDAGDFSRGIMIHLYSIRHGLDSELFVYNNLIDMYAELGGP